MEVLTQLLDSETGIKGPLLWGGIIVVALWEVLLPLRPLVYSIIVRWLSNIGIALFNYALLRWTIGFLVFDAAIEAEQRGWGLLHMADLSPWPAVVLGVLWLDLVSYVVHQVFHRIPVLWRLHRLHHSDPDVDFTTARRHHPFEILLVSPLTALAVLAAGAPPLSLLLWWTMIGVAALLVHGNFALPDRLDRVLRWVIVTPGMHRVHHSALRPETDSNYGQIFPWWDRLFRTYCDRPEGGYQEMTLGLEYFREPREQYFHRLLLQPFLRAEASPPIETPK
jgi:sterol desaturase/sphingolipid hydroxylase (fatty acid hydroxylase superfamily)